MLPYGLVETWASMPIRMHSKRIAWSGSKFILEFSEEMPLIMKRWVKILPFLYKEMKEVEIPRWCPVVLQEKLKSNHGVGTSPWSLLHGRTIIWIDFFTVKSTCVMCALHYAGHWKDAKVTLSNHDSFISIK